MRPHVRQRRVLTHAHRAVGLHRAIDNGERHAGDEDLRLGDFLQRGLRVARVDLDGRVQDDEARGVDFHPRAGDPFDYYAVCGEGLAEGFLLFIVDPRDHPFEGAFGGADGAHGVMDLGRVSVVVGVVGLIWKRVRQGIRVSGRGGPKEFLCCQLICCREIPRTGLFNSRKRQLKLTHELRKQYNSHVRGRGGLE
jgi:hypothetical protein